ncbi:MULTISPECIES: hypothetical protein [Sorangium]|uniref:PEGA domain-containing protein n=1 Tax=Sorangium cellulosum TaxID=56 RepID=A0A4P2R1X9_SORCE|nr:MULTISPECIES: hypothetical protein [Sorangium]AUX36668.1 uncharacterized protein SOCE836_088760 [Sorangium cellulosum]WCQ95966.1 hypothetical protein NQZ70_08743 [Sorangium sp. Soce836]
MEDAMKKLTMHLTGAALCALCAFAPAAALAQAPPPGAAAAAGEDEARGDIARATQLYRQGNEAFKQKRWSDAELLYLKAWALVRSFDIAANLGEVQLQLKKPRSAATFLGFALRTAPPSAKPEQIARMRHFLEEAKAQVGTVRVRVKNVADAEVLVDGERVPDEEAKHEIYLEPGEHVLAIRRAGYEEEVLRVLAAPLITETVERELKPKTEKLEAGLGATEAGATRPGAAGAPVQGDAKANAPAAGARVEEPRSWVPALALGAASVVALGVAGGFTVASNAEHNEAQAQSDVIRAEGGRCIRTPSAFSESCAALEQTVSHGEKLGDIARVAYLASGVLAVGAVAYALWPRSTTTSSSVRVSAEVRSGGGVVSVQGIW